MRQDAEVWNMKVCRSWCGHCYEYRKGRKTVSCWGKAPANRKVADMSIKRPIDPTSEESVDLGRMSPETDFERMIPTIWEWLTAGTYDDGTTRIPSTLLIMSEAGRVKVCLNDRANSRSTWKSGITLDSALTGLDEALRGDSCEWRASQGPSQKFRKK